MATVNAEKIAQARAMAGAARVAPKVLGETSRVMVHTKIENELKEALVDLSRRKTPTRADYIVGGEMPANMPSREWIWNPLHG